MSDVLSYMMCQLSKASQLWGTASTWLLRPKTELGECSSNWAILVCVASIHLQVLSWHTPLEPALTVKVLSNPVTGICLHSNETPWLYCSFPRLGIKEVRLLRSKMGNPKVTHLWKHWKPSLWSSIQISVVPQHSAVLQSKREQRAAQGICPRTWHLVSGLCLWLGPFGSHLAPHPTELLKARRC